MSRVDTKFTQDERTDFLNEVRVHLPAFLRAETSERVDPAGDVRQLLNLTKGDLARVVSTHIALSAELGDFLESLQSALRQPITSTIRPLEPTQSVRGLIDWSATYKYRATSGWDETRFVVRPARRIFDTPENRALSWAITQAEAILRGVAPGGLDDRVGVHNTRWIAEIHRRLDTLREARRHWWLRDIPGERPGPYTFKRLEAARTSVYKIHLPGLIQFLERITRDPTPDDLVDVLARRFFEPQRDWLLFELVVALRLSRAFSERSVGLRRSRLLAGASGAPFAVYEMNDGAEIRLWYQGWPRSAGTSLQTVARRRYGIQAGPVRPDIIIEMIKDGTRTGLLLELKASKSSDYLAAGLFQLMGYLKDRPHLFSTQPSGWLVAPASNAFRSQPADELELWVVDADEVGNAALEHFGYERVNATDASLPVH